MEKYKILVVNGPNINILGKREQEHYGNFTMEDLEQKLNELEKECDIELNMFQSNSEGAIVNYLQDKMEGVDGLIINPAAFSYYGYAILDTLTAYKVPYVEVHISNIFKREQWHKESIFSKYAIGVISGFKKYVYELGTYAIIDFLNQNN